MKRYHWHLQMVENDVEQLPIPCELLEIPLEAIFNNQFPFTIGFKIELKPEFNIDSIGRMFTEFACQTSVKSTWAFNLLLNNSCGQLLEKWSVKQIELLNADFSELDFTSCELTTLTMKFSYKEVFYKAVSNV